MELNSKNMEKSMLKIKQELNSLKLKQLRCTHAAWYYAEEKENKKIIYCFSYAWASLMQDKFDHGYDLQQIATDDLYLVLRWVNVESPEFTLDQEFVVECLAIISKFWNDFRACKSLLAWYEKIYC